MSTPTPTTSKNGRLVLVLKPQLPPLPCNDNVLLFCPPEGGETFRIQFRDAVARDKMADLFHLMRCKGFCGTVDDYLDYELMQTILHSDDPYETGTSFACGECRHDDRFCKVCFLPLGSNVSLYCKGTYCANSDFEFDPMTALM